MLERLIRFGLIATFATAVAGYGVAHAQFEDDDMGEMEDDEFGDDEFGDEDFGDSELADEAAEDEGGDVEATPAGTATLTAWTDEIVSRPNTLPAGSWSFGANIFADKSFDAVGGLPAALAPGSTPLLMGSYGVNDQLEVNVGYSFLLKEFEAKGDFVVGGGFNVIRDDQLDVTPRALLGYSFLSEGLAPLVAGADIKYLLNDKMAILSPASHLVISMQAIDLGIAEVQPMFLQLPVGFAYQATPQVYLQADTTLAQIKIKDVDSRFFGADYIPLQLGGFFTPNSNMDVGAALQFGDLKEAGDTLGFMAMFRYYGLQ